MLSWFATLTQRLRPTDDPLRTPGLAPKRPFRKPTLSGEQVCMASRHPLKSHLYNLWDVCFLTQKCSARCFKDLLKMKGRLQKQKNLLYGIPTVASPGLAIYFIISNGKKRSPKAEWQDPGPVAASAIPTYNEIRQDSAALSGS